MLKINTQFNGNLIKKELGKGNFGIVYQASNSKFATDFALKECSSTVKEHVQRFRNENTMLHTLKTHARIIEPLSKINTHNAIIYYLMELADSNLQQHLDTNTLSEKEKIALFKKICEGVQYAHSKGVMHRDLWWDNVLIKKVNNVFEPKINDFGRARSLATPIVGYKPSNIWGCNLVVPPEHMFDVLKYDNEDDFIVGDIYALGIILNFTFSAIQPAVMQSFFIQNSKANFETLIVNGNIKFKTNLEKFDSWLQWIAPSNLEQKLSVVLLDSGYDKVVNELILNMCKLDHRARIQDINDIITVL